MKQGHRDAVYLPGSPRNSTDESSAQVLCRRYVTTAAPYGMVCALIQPL
jgi:hypothetical protein